MTMAAKIDFSLIPVIDVARELFGPESRERSSAIEKHFPGHSGLYVNVPKNKWYSHGNETGGDALDLVSFATGRDDFKVSLSWLQSRGYAQQSTSSPKQPLRPAAPPQPLGPVAPPPPRKQVAQYNYRDENGVVLYQVVRYDPKDFSQRRSDGNGGWVWKGPELAVPYRLPELIKSVEPVLIPGGEKDVDNLRALGLTATGNHGGESKWWPELSEWFRGRRVFILCDNDPQGEKPQAVIDAELKDIANEIRVVRFTELKEGGDVSDFIEARRKEGIGDAAIRNELAERFRDAPAWAGDNSYNSQFVAADRAPEPDPTHEKAPWPVMAEAAYHGLAGDVVRTIDPHTEADPVALLMTFLACAGNVMGRTHYFLVEGNRHNPNLFSLLAGDSAKARKGTSYGRVKQVVEIADKEWASDRTKGGLSSGEGFINEVRDPVRKWDAKDQGWETVDPGAPDKRLLVVEPEFAAALAVMERHGNTLSPLIRKAWDGDKLSTLTKNSPLTATDAHVSIVGHITEAELKARLTRTDAANGFANRFLFVLVRRSKLLPFGGNLADSEIEHLGERLKEAITKLPAVSRVTMTDAARAAWVKVYARLSADRFGLLGAVTARAEAQVVRLSLIFALLDGTAQINVQHLEAGLAVWEYCEASAARIFGGILGDPVADDIMMALKATGDAGLSRTDIHHILGRNKSSEEIGAALSLLESRGLVVAGKSTAGTKAVPIWLTNVRRTNSTNDDRPEER